MNNISILVTGSNSITGLNIIKALKPYFKNLYGCDMCPINENTCNLYTKNFNIPKAIDNNYCFELFKIITNYHITHLIICNDHEIRTLLNSNINKYKISINAFTNNTKYFLNKKQTNKLLLDNNITHPSECCNTDFPYVIRSCDVGQGQKYVHIIKNEKDLSSIDTAHLNGYKTKFILGDEYSIDLLAINGIVYSVVPRKRIIVKNGMIWKGEIIKDEFMIQKCIELSKKLLLNGMYCIQCIRTNNDCYFFEINSRPGSGLELSIEAGVNMPHLWVTSHYQPIKFTTPTWGLKMVRQYTSYYYL